jgi:hypothetical protein
MLDWEFTVTYSKNLGFVPHCVLFGCFAVTLVLPKAAKTDKQKTD